MHWYIREKNIECEIQKYSNNTGKKHMKNKTVSSLRI